MCDLTERYVSSITRSFHESYANSASKRKFGHGQVAQNRQKPNLQYFQDFGRKFHHGTSFSFFIYFLFFYFLSFPCARLEGPFVTEPLNKTQSVPLDRQKTAALDNCTEMSRTERRHYYWQQCH
jgi:hypothetical protein